MQYHQPLDQPTNPNAPYIDGNPSLGIEGSIIPAASIEYTQREIVNFLTDSTYTPTDSDLHQLSRSVQLDYVNWAIDSGPANQMQITAVPAPPNYTAGLK